MRGAALGLAAGALVLTGCSAVSGDEQPLPEVTVLEFGTDQPVDVSSLRGPMVVNLWASYCGPCRQEMPILQDFHERHGDEVEVVGVDYQDPQVGQARKLADETGVTYRLLADPGGDLSSADPLPNIMALPFLMFVDDDGNVTYMEYAEVTSLRQLEDLVSVHLGVDL
jgi:thiol-disulfide isomerase/thioredoxin